MEHWIYINKDSENVLRVAISTSLGNIVSNPKLIEQIVYLRPFNLPFDAIAHKHLLDYLSKETVLKYIDKHKNETNRWLRTIR